MIQEASIHRTSSSNRSAWFYIAWSCGALVSSFFFLPTFFYDDMGPTYGHFSLPGAFISTATASICTWTFFNIPFQQIFPKLVSLVLLFAGLYLGFGAVFTYTAYTWNPDSLPR
jgi:hypothetical protein